MNIPHILIKIPTNTLTGWGFVAGYISHVSQGQIELRLQNGGVEKFKPLELASIVDAFN